MPLTPQFTLKQDDNNVYIDIIVPHIRVSDTEIIAERFDFSFYCKPYLLKLTFPCEFAINSSNIILCNDNNSDQDKVNQFKALYDPTLNNGTIKITLPKLIIGEFFPNLDLLTILLPKRTTNKSNIQSKAMIEVISSIDLPDIPETIESKAEEQLVDQITQSLDKINISLSINHSYGFNNYYSNMIESFLEDNVFEYSNIRRDLFVTNQLTNDLSNQSSNKTTICINPEKLTFNFRRILRLSQENVLFDYNRYLSDYYDIESDYIYQESMNYNTIYNSYWNNRSKLLNQSIEFTNKEKEILLSLPNKEYLIESHSLEQMNVLYGLVDIVQAYCYDYRITQSETNIESAYNIARLSSLFSWLDSYHYQSSSSFKHISIPESNELLNDSIDQVILFFMRRCVIYPYIRSWKFIRKILSDTAKVLYLGKRVIIKCLLHLYMIYQHTNNDSYYILNKLYLIDYIVYIQQIDDKILFNLANSYNESKRIIESSESHGKSLVSLNLIEIENWADSLIDSNIDSDIDSNIDRKFDLPDHLKLNINNNISL